MNDAEDAERVDPEVTRIFERLLGESTGMTSSMRQELFQQQKQLLGGYTETPPTVVVASTEGNTLFRGMDPKGDMLAAVSAAAAEIGRNPRGSVEAYADKLEPPDAAGESVADASPAADEG